MRGVMSGLAFKNPKEKAAALEAARERLEKEHLPPPKPKRARVFQSDLQQQEKAAANPDYVYFDNSDLKDLLDVVAGAGNGILSDWEENFIASITQQVDRRRRLTVKQYGILERIAEKVTCGPHR